MLTLSDLRATRPRMPPLTFPHQGCRDNHALNYPTYALYQKCTFLFQGRSISEKFSLNGMQIIATCILAVRPIYREKSDFCSKCCGFTPFNVTELRPLSARRHFVHLAVVGTGDCGSTPVMSTLKVEKIDKSGKICLCLLTNALTLG